MKKVFNCNTHLSVDLNTRVGRYALGVYNEICMALGGPCRGRVSSQQSQVSVSVGNKVTFQLLHPSYNTYNLLIYRYIDI